jgi:uncharacterized membrane protein YbhN (UPF0104 family)
MSPEPDSADRPRPVGAGQPHGRGITGRPWWPRTKRLLTFAFFALVAYFLVTQARTVQWNEVLATVRQRPLKDMLAAMALAAASYALYSCFDLIGRYYTQHKLAVRKVVTVNFISYAFNLNLGALVGGLAFRYRLYSRLGLDADVITRVVTMSMLTNWLGYMLLAGLAFWWWPLSPPPDWKLDAFSLRVLGFLLVAATAAYISMCALARRRSWTIRGHELTLPSLRLATLQLAMSTLNWSLIAGTVYMLLGQKIPYPVVLEVMLVAAIAGVITHVPAGLGVLEAVFIALLSHLVPKYELLAALLTYRAIYYLAPLVVAALIYLVIEARTKIASSAAG